MVLETEIANSKAIMGAAFIQYLIYGVLYVLEGSKYNEFYPSQKGNKEA